MKLLHFLPVFLLLLSSCGDYKPLALGPDGKIIVFADSSILRLAKTGLNATLEQTVTTLPQPEPLFTLMQGKPEKFDDLKQRAYLLFISALNDTTPSGKLTKRLLSPEILEKVKSGEQNIFVTRNKYMDRQLSVFILADTPEKLSEVIKADSANLITTFLDLTLQRTALDMFKRHTQPELSEKMMDKTGFSVAFQHDYVMIRDTVGPNFFYMKRIQPDLDRWIWIHWWNQPSGLFPTKEELLAKQDSIMKVHIQADDSSYSETVSSPLTFKEVNFNGFYGLETRGTWRLNDYSMGGPFVTYTFYNDSLKQVFMINGSVFGPKFPEKMQFIREMEVIAKTIRFKQGKGSVSAF
ncbi:MAG: DUF4837 family protein [Bacteroidetes bacterium]|nr:DUF4837 family protein [Bacteroidota bacterium]